MNDLTGEQKNILKSYSEGPKKLAGALAPLTEVQLEFSPPEGGWTIRQIANHIVDGDDIWKICLKAALGNQEGWFTLQWYWEKTQVEWADQWAYSSRDLSLAVALCKANRAHIINLVQNIPAAWERSIRIQWPHERESRISVGDILEMQANHLIGHVEDILNILRARGVDKGQE